MFKKCPSVSQEKKWLCEKKKESMEHEIHENTCRTWKEHEQNMNVWSVPKVSKVSTVSQVLGSWPARWSFSPSGGLRGSEPALVAACHASSTDHWMLKLESHEALLRADLKWFKWIDENWATPHFATLIHLRSKRSQWQRSTRLWPATGTQLPRVDQVAALTIDLSCWDARSCNFSSMQKLWILW